MVGICQESKVIINYNFNNYTYNYCCSYFNVMLSPCLCISGLRVAYNVTQPAGSRIISLKVRRKSRRKNSYVYFDDQEYYKIAVTSYIAKKRGDFADLGKHLLNSKRGPVDADVLSRYISTFTPLSIKKDGRIKVVK